MEDAVVASEEAPMFNFALLMTVFSSRLANQTTERSYSTARTPAASVRNCDRKVRHLGHDGRSATRVRPSPLRPLKVPGYRLWTRALAYGNLSSSSTTSVARRIALG